MKLQHLAVIFILIILPITIVLSTYIQTHISTIQLESQYTTRLMSATHDAALSFQINTANNGYSTTQDSKMRDIEAAVTTFFNSLSLAMGSEGYTQEELQLYTPAILCTLYDGYYIYTKYNDIRYAITEPYTIGTLDYIGDTPDGTTNLTQDNYVYGLKPFITYSCRYDDFVVNYTLDNSITIIGKVGGDQVTKTGHLIRLPGNTATIRGIYELTLENKTTIDSYIKDNIMGSVDTQEYLEENLIFYDNYGAPESYNYIVYNSQKYYKDNTVEEKYFWYGSDYRKNYVTSSDLFDDIKYAFDNNTPALKYYEEAVVFSNWVNDNLGNITQNNANESFGDNYTQLGTNKIFYTKTVNNDPLDSNSYFNEHRMNVIKKSISTNLNTVISTFGNVGSEFRLPKISEPEWYNITNNISVVSFLQGIPIKSKTYNKYCVVSNNTNKETVSTDSIYVVDKHGEYHRPGCLSLIEKVKNNGVTNEIKGMYSAVDFERKSILRAGENVSSRTTAEDISAFFYPQGATACYDCIVNASYINSIDKIIKEGEVLEYKGGGLTKIANTDTNLTQYRQWFLRALARERYNLYTINGYFGD